MLAIALPFVAGTMVWWPWPGPYGFASSEMTFYTVAGAGVLTTIGGAFLVTLFSRRKDVGFLLALLVTPAWMVGEFLGEAVPLLLLRLGLGGWIGQENETHFWDFQMFLVVTVIPLLLCAVLGIGCGRALRAWKKY